MNETLVNRIRCTSRINEKEKIKSWISTVRQRLDEYNNAIHSVLLNYLMEGINTDAVPRKFKGEWNIEHMNKWSKKFTSNTEYELHKYK